MTGLRRRLLIARLADAGALTLGASAAITLGIRAISLGSQGLVSASFGASLELDGFFIALLAPALIVTPLSTAIEIGGSATVARVLDEKPAEARLLARKTVLWSSGVGVAVAGVASALSPFLVVALSPGAGVARHEIARSVAWFIYPAMAPQIVAAALATLHFGAGRVQRPLILRASTPIAIVAALAASPDGNIHVLGGAVLVGSIAEVSLLAATLPASFRRQILSRQGGEEFQSALRAIRPLLLALVIGRAIPIVDQAFVASLEVGELTRYAIAVRLFDAATAMVIVPNARLVTNRLAAARVQGDDAGRRLVQRELALSALVGGAATVLFAASVPIVIFLVYSHGAFETADAWATVRLALLLSLAFGPLAIAHVGPRIAVAADRTRMLLPIMIAELAFNLVLDALLIDALGSAGVVLATLLTYCIVAFTYVLIVRSSSTVFPQ